MGVVIALAVLLVAALVFGALRSKKSHLPREAPRRADRETTPMSDEEAKREILATERWLLDKMTDDLPERDLQEAALHMAAAPVDEVAPMMALEFQLRKVYFEDAERTGALAMYIWHLANAHGHEEQELANNVFRLVEVRLRGDRRLAQEFEAEVAEKFRQLPRE